MEAELKKTVLITLKLTQTEAFWLKSLMQNFYGDPEEEPPQSRIMRATLFDALPNFDELR